MTGMGKRLKIEPITRSSKAVLQIKSTACALKGMTKTQTTGSHNWK